MSEFEYEVADGKVTITGYRGKGGDVVIPEFIDGYPVTRIGLYAFYACSSLTSITLGNSLTTIGYRAFSYCSGLTSITLGNSITTIGNEAFEGCTGLTSITLGNSITTIGNDAFSYCSGLTSISLPDGCSIGEGMFDDCPATITIRDKEDEE